MKWIRQTPVFIVILLIIQAGASYLAGADQEPGKLYLKKLIIEGNDVTDEKYIRSLLALEEGNEYQLEVLMKKINKSREKLLQSGLFSEVFFNDEYDKQEHLILTLKLKEKNYFLFGPSGYMGYEDESFYCFFSVYINHTNLFGNSSNLYVEIPVYENRGLLLFFKSRPRNLRYSVEAEYVYESGGPPSLKLMPGAAFSSGDGWLGMELLFNKTDMYCFAVYPYFETGRRDPVLPKGRKWYFLALKPFYGYNQNGSSFYGFSALLDIYRDIFLKIVYSLNTSVSIIDGSIPQNLILNTNVRGTNPESFTGNKRVSVKNQLNIPLPWNNRIQIAPFLDCSIIGYNTMDFMLGGGVGLRYYTTYQSPLIIDLAFGKGIMLNFQTRF
ncbi:MAG: POTRA domain-containing protein [Spirochaetota bacterium]